MGCGLEDQRRRVLMAFITASQIFNIIYSLKIIK